MQQSSPVFSANAGSDLYLGYNVSYIVKPGLTTRYSAERSSFLARRGAGDLGSSRGRFAGTAGGDGVATDGGSTGPTDGSHGGNGGGTDGVLGL